MCAPACPLFLLNNVGFRDPHQNAHFRRENSLWSESQASLVENRCIPAGWFAFLPVELILRPKLNTVYLGGGLR